MKCGRCGQETFASTTTEAVELGGGALLVIRNIPCWKCAQCDEIFYKGDVVERLEKLIAAAKEQMRQVTIIDYSMAA